jgi:hypothetical protein
MLCQGCNQAMQRETVVRVLRVGVFGRTRSVVQGGWHCWTCGTTGMRSAQMPGSVSADVAPREIERGEIKQHRRPGNLPALLLALGGPSSGCALGAARSAG